MGRISIKNLFKKRKQLENEAQKIATDKGRLQNETNLTAAQISNLNAEAKSKNFKQKSLIWLNLQWIT